MTSLQLPGSRCRTTARSRIVALVSVVVLVAVNRDLVVAFDPPAVFPISTRQALADKAKTINQQQQKQRYTTAGWSNRAATILTPQHLNPNVYTADRPFYWNSIDVGCRCTIIELPSASSPTKPDLWVHSPVGLDGPMQQALDQLGNVKYVVSPNYEHVKFAPQWAQAYPDCQMWGCPGLMERMPQIQWKGEIPHGYRPVTWTGPSSVCHTNDDQLWDTTVIQPLHIDVEVNPFTGNPFFNEVIYYHAPSKALMLTDLFWNYPSGDGIPNSQYGRDDSWELAPPVESVPLKSQLWKFAMDQVYGPFFTNVMIQKGDEYRALANHIVNVWDVEMIIPAHGDIMRGKDFIRSVLTKHFQL